MSDPVGLLLHSSGELENHHPVAPCHFLRVRGTIACRGLLTRRSPTRIFCYLCLQIVRK